MVLKPSEISQSTERVLAEVLPRYLDQVRVALPRRPPCPTSLPLPAGEVQLSPGPAVSPEPPVASQSCFAVVLGGPEETGRLLEHKFDYIFFTGEGSPGQCPGGAGTSESRVRKAVGGGGCA